MGSSREKRFKVVRRLYDEFSGEDLDCELVVYVPARSKKAAIVKANDRADDVVRPPIVARGRSVNSFKPISVEDVTISDEELEELLS